MDEILVLEKEYDGKYDEVDLYNITTDPDPDDSTLMMLESHVTQKSIWYHKCPLMVSLCDLYVFK